MKLNFKRMRDHCKVPTYATVGSSGLDFYAREEIRILPNEIVTIPTGIGFEIPIGFEMQIRGRSGLLAKQQIAFIGGIGTIDSDYRGEVHITLMNLGKFGQILSKGDRIAQGIICPIIKVELNEVLELSETSRGLGGLGSTGK